MSPEIKLAPSILAADFARLAAREGLAKRLAEAAAR